MDEKLNDFIDNRTDGDLVMLCKEIYDWHITGNLSKDSYIYKTSIDFSCSAKQVEELIVNKSVKKLGKVVLLLLQKMPTKL